MCMHVLSVCHCRHITLLLSSSLLLGVLVDNILIYLISIIEAQNNQLSTIVHVFVCLCEFMCIRVDISRHFSIVLEVGCGREVIVDDAHVYTIPATAVIRLCLVECTFSPCMHVVFEIQLSIGCVLLLDDFPFG